MENSQLKDLQEEVSEATKQYILTTFNSENGMKTYYLQMSNIIRSAHINPPIDTEYNSLKKLSKKLKQYCTFIQTLGEHEWDKGIADIQKALGIYLMQNDIEPNAEELIASLIPTVLSQKIFTAAVDSNASEHAARTLAMQVATDNANELIQDLTKQYNKSRQQAITNELLDIVGGSMK